jgi:hypothetical protein
MSLLAIANVQKAVRVLLNDHFKERHLFKMLSLDLELRFTVTFLLQVLFVEKVDFWTDSHNDVVFCEKWEKERLLFSCLLEGGFFAAPNEDIALEEHKVYFARSIVFFQSVTLFLDFDRFFGSLTLILCFFLMTVLFGSFFWLWSVNYHYR